MRKQIFVVLSFALSCAACGAPSNEPASVSSQTPETQDRTQAIDACGLVTPEALGALFEGRSFVIDHTSPSPRNRAGAPGQNTITSCTFVSAAPEVRDILAITILVTIAPSDGAHQSVAAMKAGAQSLGLSPPVDIPGLGDGAYWVNAGTAQRSAIAINVQHNPRIWLTVSESSVGQDTALTVDRLTAVARQALALL